MDLDGLVEVFKLCEMSLQSGDVDPKTRNEERYVTVEIYDKNKEQVKYADQRLHQTQII